MKKLLVLTVGLGIAGSAAAQLFTPESITGAGFGAITGAIIGGRHAGEGAAIGAGAGFLLGTLLHESREERGYYARRHYPYYYGYSPAYYYYPPPGYYVTAPANPAPAPADPPPQTSPRQPLETVPTTQFSSASAMSSANALFGR